MNQPTQTPLDFIAESYWNDYTQGRPIDGGIAYELQLRQCQLNGSINSLKQLDNLLLNIRQDLQNKLASNSHLLPQQKQQIILQKDEFRRLLMFIGFYVGKVLAFFWKSPTQWYGSQDLQQIDARFATDNDFLRSIAVRFISKDKESSLQTTQTTGMDSPWLFFPLEVVGMQLFGNQDYQIYSMQAKAPVVSSLYQSILLRLPSDIVNQIQQQEQSQNQASQTTPNQMATQSSHQPSVSALSASSASVSQTTPLVNSQSVEIQSINQTDKAFNELMNELKTINFPQMQGKEEYQKAKQVMEKFDEHLKKQNLPASEVKFSNNHIKTRNQALALMKKSADLGNSTAMLHFARYLMKGEWLKQNQSAGVSLIQTAANAKDPRAMSLLSKLHYQGLGVSQDNKLGEYWLEQAANSGHPEAKIVQKQIAMAQMMIEERSEDMATDKKYLTAIGITLLIGLIVFIVL